MDELAPCLAEGGPIAAAGAEFIAAAALGDSAAASALRAWCVAHVFGQVEEIFASGKDPVAGVRDMLFRTAGTLRAMQESGLSKVGAKSGQRALTDAAVEAITGDHYGNLFSSFDADSYWKQTPELLRARFERNGITMADLAGKSTLDAGCGGGRYTFALRQLGASPVVGFDYSPINVSTGRDRAAEAGINDVKFQEGDVLHLPFADNSFDIVFSNGVLHHTRDWQRGIQEMVRVLKPGGMGWLYLIENPGGLFWDSIEILRIVMQNEDFAAARMALRTIGIPANRIFYMLDHVMVPINVRLTPKQIEDALSAAGATGVRRLERGTDFDRVERIYQKDAYAVEKFGVGENRHLFTK
jgi:ubiquinone/menaquinone biosynthesis C-methylase UbiE